MKGGTPIFRDKSSRKGGLQIFQRRKEFKPDISRWTLPLKSNIPQLNKLKKEKSYIPSNTYDRSKSVRSQATM